MNKGAVRGERKSLKCSPLNISHLFQEGKAHSHEARQRPCGYVVLSRSLVLRLNPAHVKLHLIRLDNGSIVEKEKKTRERKGKVIDVAIRVTSINVDVCQMF